MPKALRSTTCKDLFDWDTQKDAMCTACKNAMDPLLISRRARSSVCEKPWDSKWSVNRYEHIRLRYHAATKHMKDKPDADISVESACPSALCKTTEEVMDNNNSDVSSSEVIFTSSCEKEVE